MHVHNRHTTPAPPPKTPQSGEREGSGSKWRRQTAPTALLPRTRGTYRHRRNYFLWEKPKTWLSSSYQRRPTCKHHPALNRSPPARQIGRELKTAASPWGAKGLNPTARTCTEERTPKYLWRPTGLRSTSPTGLTDQRIGSYGAPRGRTHLPQAQRRRRRGAPAFVWEPFTCLTRGLASAWRAGLWFDTYAGGSCGAPEREAGRLHL